MRVISLGWGVQSFTLAAMAALGEIEAVDWAIHADTTWERDSTYEFARKYTPWLEDRGVRVITVVSDGAARVEGISGVMPLPAHSGGGGMLRRQCTYDWKVRPIQQWLRKRGARNVDMLLWISLDEWQRAKDSDKKWITNKFPLIDMRMTRGDCVNWLVSHGLDVPTKSSCVFCPYHSRKDWEELKRAGGRDWERAVKVDTMIRDLAPPHPIYVHPRLKPLEQAVIIAEDYDMEQGVLCDGFCMI